MSIFVMGYDGNLLEVEKTDAVKCPFFFWRTVKSGIFCAQ